MEVNAKIKWYILTVIYSFIYNRIKLHITELNYYFLY